AGHHVHTVTRPGMESVATDRRHIGLEETIGSLVAIIDDTPGDIVLIGHSGGGSVVYGATDRRPHRIRHVIYVDSGPLPDGSAVNPSLPGDGIEIPLPSWAFFNDNGKGTDLRDLSAEMLANFRARAIP